MKHSLLAHSMATYVAIGFATPLLAAGTAATGTGTALPTAQQSMTINKTAGQCLTDLRAFDSMM
ncbi:MAG: hypothetical protein ABIN69_05230 [Aestuariivirga sp.]